MQMKTFAALFVAFASTAALGAASGAVASADEVSGCDCNNMCPLAQEANHHRATGDEAIVSSKLVRAEYVRVVLKNLATL